MKTLENDLNIQLSPTQIEPVGKWIETFKSRKTRTFFSPPCIDGGFLRVSAADFPWFLTYVDARDSNEFDVHRLRANGLSQIKRLLIRKRSPIMIHYYKQRLLDLESVTVGDEVKFSAN